MVMLSSCGDCTSNPCREFKNFTCKDLPFFMEEENACGWCDEWNTHTGDQESEVSVVVTLIAFLVVVLVNIFVFYMFYIFVWGDINLPLRSNLSILKNKIKILCLYLLFIVFISLLCWTHSYLMFYTFSLMISIVIGPSIFITLFLFFVFGLIELVPCVCGSLRTDVEFRTRCIVAGIVASQNAFLGLALFLVSYHLHLEGVRAVRERVVIEQDRIRRNELLELRRIYTWLFTHREVLRVWFERTYRRLPQGDAELLRLSNDPRVIYAVNRFNEEPEPEPLFIEQSLFVPRKASTLGNGIVNKLPFKCDSEWKYQFESLKTHLLNRLALINHWDNFMTLSRLDKPLEYHMYHEDYNAPFCLRDKIVASTLRTTIGVQQAIAKYDLIGNTVVKYGDYYFLRTRPNCDCGLCGAVCLRCGGAFVPSLYVEKEIKFFYGDIRQVKVDQLFWPSCICGDRIYDSIATTCNRLQMELRFYTLRTPRECTHWMSYFHEDSMIFMEQDIADGTYVPYDNHTKFWIIPNRHCVYPKFREQARLSEGAKEQLRLEKYERKMQQNVDQRVAVKESARRKAIIEQLKSLRSSLSEMDKRRTIARAKAVSKKFLDNYEYSEEVLLLSGLSQRSVARDLFSLAVNTFGVFESLTNGSTRAQFISVVTLFDTVERILEQRMPSYIEDVHDTFTTLLDKIGMSRFFQVTGDTSKSYDKGGALEVDVEYKEEWSVTDTYKALKDGVVSNMVNRLCCDISCLMISVGDSDTSFLRTAKSGWDTIKDIYYTLNLPKAKSIVDIGIQVWELLVYVVKTGYQCWKMRSLNPLLHGSELSILEERYTKFVSDFSKRNTTGAGSRVEVLTTIASELIVEYEKIRKKSANNKDARSFKDWGPATTYAIMRLDFLRKAKDELNDILSNSELREQPFSVMFFGDSAVGKSTAAMNIMHFIMKRNGIPDGPENIVAGNLSDKFFSEYTMSHLGIFYDDVANDHPDYTEVNPNSNLIKVMNNMPTSVLKADVSEKAKIFMRAMVVVGTTNVWHLNLPTTSMKPIAGMRRWNYFVTTIVRPCLRKPGQMCLDESLLQELNGEKWFVNGNDKFRTNDIWLFDISVARESEKTNGAIAGSISLCPVAKALSMIELQKFLGDKSLLHFDRQRSLVNSMRELSRTELCKKCSTLTLGMRRDGVYGCVHPSCDVLAEEEARLFIRKISNDLFECARCLEGNALDHLTFAEFINNGSYGRYLVCDMCLDDDTILNYSLFEKTYVRNPLVLIKALCKESYHGFGDPVINSWARASQVTIFEDYQMMIRRCGILVPIDDRKKAYQLTAQSLSLFISGVDFKSAQYADPYISCKPFEECYLMTARQYLALIGRFVNSRGGIQIEAAELISNAIMRYIDGENIGVDTYVPFYVLNTNRLDQSLFARCSFYTKRWFKSQLPRYTRPTALKVIHYTNSVTWKWVRMSMNAVMGSIVALIASDGYLFTSFCMGILAYGLNTLCEKVKMMCLMKIRPSLSYFRGFVDIYGKEIKIGFLITIALAFCAFTPWFVSREKVEQDEKVKRARVLTKWLSGKLMLTPPSNWARDNPSKLEEVMSESFQRRMRESYREMLEKDPEAEFSVDMFIPGAKEQSSLIPLSWFRSDIVRENLSGIQTTTTLPQLTNRLQRTMRRLVIKRENGEATTTILPVCSRWWLINRHCLRGIKWPVEVIVKDVYPSTKKTDLTLFLTQNDVVECNDGRDFAIIHIESMLNNDNLGYFPETPLKSLSGYNLVLDGEVCPLRSKRLMSHVNGIEYSSLVWVLKNEGKRTTYGDCGSPYVLDNSAGVAIVGIHCGANEGGSVVCCPINRGDVIRLVTEGMRQQNLPNIIFGADESVPDCEGLFAEEEFNQFDNEINDSLGPYGKLVVKYSVPGRTYHSDLKPGLLCNGLVKRGFKPKFGPPKGMNSPEHVIKYLRDCSQDKPYDPIILDKATKDMVATYERVRNINPYRFELLTYEESMNGIPGFPLVDRANMNASAGWNYFMKKGSWFGIEPGEPVKYNPNSRCWRRIQLIEQSMEKGVVPKFVFRATLKDELRAFKTPDTPAKPPRVFAASPLDHYILFRRYLGSFVAWTAQNKIALEMGTYVNPFGPGWKDFHMLLKRTSNTENLEGNAGDYKNYDREQRPQICRAANIIVSKFHEDQPPKILKIIMMLMFSHVDTYIEFDGRIFRVHGITNSGEHLTIWYNSLNNSVYFRYAYYYINPQAIVPSFQDNIMLLTYGDDSINARKCDVEFGLDKIALALSTIGITITDATKSINPVPYLAWDEYTFLKREFVPDGDRIMGPRELKHVVKNWHWRSTSSGHTPEATVFDRLDEASRELVLHGRKIYDEWYSKIIDTAEELFAKGEMAVRPERISYDEALQRWRSSYDELKNLGFVSYPTIQECRDAILAGSISLVHRGEAPPTEDLIEFFEQSGISIMNLEENVTMTMSNENAEHNSCGEMKTDLSGDYRATLATFLKRPILIDRQTWTVGLGLDASIEPWNLWLSNTIVKKKLSNYYAMRFKLKLRFVLTGNSFLMGRLGCFYRATPFNYRDAPPLTDYYEGDQVYRSQQNFYATSTHVVGDVFSLSVLPGVIIDPASNTSIEMELPFLFPLDYLNLVGVDGNGDYVHSLGTLYYRALTSTLKHANGGTGGTTLSVFAWAEDVELVAPTFVEQGLFNTVDEVLERVGSIRSKASRTLGALGRIPVIGSYVRPLQEAMEFARENGLSRPLTDDAKMFPKYVGSLSHSFGPDRSESLTLHPRVQLSVSPNSTSDTNVDEMSVAYVVSKEVIFNRFTWAASDSPGSVLFAIEVTPRIGTTIDTSSLHYCTNGAAVIPAPCGVPTMFSRYWNGTMCYRFRVCASTMHRGRLGFRLEPCRTASYNTDDYNTNYLHLMDIGSDMEIVVIVDWNSDRSYLFCSPNANGDSPCEDWVMGSSSIPAGPQLGVNGILTVEVVNTLVGPGVGAPVSVEIVASAWAQPDMKFCGYFDELCTPCSLAQTATTMSFVEQSASSCDSNANTCVCELGDQVTSSTIDMDYCGDRVANLRNLIKRYQFQTSAPDIGVSGNGGTTMIVKNDFPPCGYSILSENIVYDDGALGAGYTSMGQYTDAVTSGGPYLTCFNATTMFHYITQCYLTRRGAVRFKAVSAWNEIAGVVFTVHRRPFASVSTLTMEVPTTVNVDSTSGTVYSMARPYVNRLTGMGTSLANTKTNVLEYEVPYDSSTRFANARSLSTYGQSFSSSYVPSFNNLPVTSGCHVLCLQHGNTSTTQLRGFMSYFAAGEDYNLTHFMNPPPVYFGNIPTTTLTKLV